MSTKESILENIKREGGSILEYEYDFQNDYDIVLAAVNNDGLALEFASDELKANFEIALEAVKNDGLAIEFASEDLQNNIDIAKAAITNNIEACDYIEYELVHYITNEKQCDSLSSASFEETLETVSRDGIFLKYVSDKYKNDKIIVNAAVENNYSAFKYASDELQNDYDFIFTLISKNGLLLSIVKDKFKNNKEIVSAAVENNGRAIDYAPYQLQNDPDIITISLTSLKKKEKEKVLRNVAIDGYLLKKEIAYQSDIDVVNAAVEQCGCAIRYASEELRNDYQLALKSVKNDGFALRYVDKLKNNKELVLEAVCNKGEAIQFASEELQLDTDIISAALSNDGMALRVCDNYVKRNVNYVTIAFCNNQLSLKYASDNVKNGGLKQYFHKQVFDRESIMSFLKCACFTRRFVENNIFLKLNKHGPHFASILKRKISGYIKKPIKKCLFDIIIKVYKEI